MIKDNYEEYNKLLDELCIQYDIKNNVEFKKNIDNIVFILIQPLLDSCERVKQYSDKLDKFNLQFIQKEKVEYLKRKNTFLYKLYAYFNNVPDLTPNFEKLEAICSKK